MYVSTPGLLDVVDESTPIAGIRTNGLGSRDFPERLVCKSAPRNSIGSISCVDVNAPNSPLSVHGNLTASTFHLLAPMKAFGLTFVVGFHTL